MQKEEYDVLRLIEHGQVCYISSECQKGCLLPKWLKYHPQIEKEELFFIIESIARQLESIHRCRNNPCYQYVNPYSILMSEERELYFLDMNAKDNLEQLRIVQRRIVREHFLPVDEPYYQKASVELDLYGLGKTIQYLLSETETEPSLTKREEIQFQKIISKCLKRRHGKSFQNISEISKMIPKYNKPVLQKKEKRKLKRFFLSGFLFLGIFYAVHFARNEKSTSAFFSGAGVQKREQTGQNTEQPEKETGQAGKETEQNHLHMELGRIYFLELQNYEKSREAFEQVKDDLLADHMAVIAGCLSEGKQEDALKEALRSAEDVLLRKTESESEEGIQYYRMILKGYSVLGGEAEQVIRIGKICMKQENLTEKDEILGFMAAAYEEMGNYEEAGQMYEEQIKYKEQSEEKEELYRKTAIVYEQGKKTDQALSICRSGIEEFTESISLRLQYIRILLKDPHVDREVCIQNITEQIRACPNMNEEEEFQKLMKEHGMIVKGEKVWEKGSE